MRALELLVVVDVAMTETARLAHYVLPASSQYEKTEYTLFNFEFPTNFFHVRPAVLPRLPGTLPEPDIYARLARAMGLLPGDNVLAPLREAAGARWSSPYLSALHARQSVGGRRRALVLYETLGPTLPDGTASASVLWPAAQICARRSPEPSGAPSARRARFPIRSSPKGSSTPWSARARALPSPAIPTTTCGR